MDQLTSVVLAAGEAKRMRSRTPKALHRVCGRLLIDFPLRSSQALGARVVVVVGRAADEVRAAVEGAGAAGPSNVDVTFVEQKERLGTGHAVLQARGACPDSGAILVLPADMPLLEDATLARLVEHHRATGAAATILSVEAADPTGYGRVVREGGRPVGIVEHRDATPGQRAIREVGTSVYCFDARRFWPALSQVTPQNDQGEYYLTDVITILHASGQPIEAVVAGEAEGLGINDRKQLAAAAAVLRGRILDRLMAEGVSILDPATTYVDDTVTVGPDTVLYPGVILEGATTIGAECVIGAGCQLASSRLADRVTLKPYCVLTDSVVEGGAVLGPFCHLRPLSHIGPNAKIGNFVETKKSKIGRGAKVPHLSYVGDATVGEGVNIGAGTITCNFDGAGKYETVIEPGVFVGSNTTLIAPITVGEGAYIAAGSVISKPVPPGALAFGRARQEVKEGRGARKTAAKKKERDEG
jgi:bifunctional UDP-N-acetylglucosamine pyrophosphorylase / glucosamine-1-phosphate N-acetyltransferase